MPIKLLPGGFVMSTRTSHKREPGLRDKTKGWTPGVSRRNNLFLMSVDREQLHGHGYACTYTLRDCPPLAADFQILVKSLFMAFRRHPSGFIRYHVVVEWQPRTNAKDPDLRGKSVPHLHVAVWFERMANISPETHLVDVWLRICERAGYVVNSLAQHTKDLLADPVGWFRYTIKHVMRGEDHYQRCIENAPAGWREDGSFGRMWFRGGDWPIVDPDDVDYEFLDPNVQIAFRRRALAWQIAQLDATTPYWFYERGFRVWHGGQLRGSTIASRRADRRSRVYLKCQLKSVGHNLKKSDLRPDQLEARCRSFGSSVWCPTLKLLSKVWLLRRIGSDYSLYLVAHGVLLYEPVDDDHPMKTTFDARVLDLEVQRKYRGR